MDFRMGPSMDSCMAFCMGPLIDPRMDPRTEFMMTYGTPPRAGLSGRPRPKSSSPPVMTPPAMPMQMYGPPSPMRLPSPPKPHPLMESGMELWMPMGMPMIQPPLVPPPLPPRPFPMRPGGMEDSFPYGWEPRSPPSFRGDYHGMGMLRPMRGPQRREPRREDPLWLDMPDEWDQWDEEGADEDPLVREIKRSDRETQQREYRRQHSREPRSPQDTRRMW